jgi:AraC family transcriptional regulator
MLGTDGRGEPEPDLESVTNRHSAPLAGHRMRQLQAGPFELSESSYEPSTRTEEHAHAVTSLVFCLDGELSQRHGTRTGELARNSLLVLPAGAPHADTVSDSGCRCLFITLRDFTPDRIGVDRRILEVASFTRDGRLSRIGWALHQELATGDVSSALAAEGLVLQLLARLAREAPPTPLTTPRWVQALRDQLHDEPSTPISLPEVGAAAGVHPTHVVRAFTAAFGMPPGRYARKLRLDLAAAALAHSELPLSRIAADAGFYDQSHFTRLFRDEMGVTPGEYRRACGRRGSAA